jgi:hypothetical protein
MTIAICIKVNDGIVLATDSASTLSDKNGVIKVYENADKLANLYKGLPIGIITWGAGSIGSASTATLIKDFRKRIMGFDADPQKWSINKTEYSIQEMANKFKEFIFDDIYKKYYSEQQDFVQGFLIAGYSAHSDMAEAWKIQIVKDKCFGPEPVLDNEKCGINWFGKTEAVVRLVYGIDPMLESVLRKNEIREEKVQKIMKSITNSWSTDLISDPMPIQDAVDLAKFLVELTKNYFRFKPGAAIVGGPTEIAAITKHEGFKWITRKLYYDRELNL